jgi:hypothetical protein
MDLGAELDVIAGRDESLLADARRDQASIGPLAEESKDQERSGADGTGRCASASARRTLIARCGSPALARLRPSSRRRAKSVSRSSTGVSSQASSINSIAASGAPRPRAEPAASTSAAATSSIGARRSQARDVSRAPRRSKLARRARDGPDVDDRGERSRRRQMRGADA